MFWPIDNHTSEILHHAIYMGKQIITECLESEMKTMIAIPIHN